MTRSFSTQLPSSLRQSQGLKVNYGSMLSRPSQLTFSRQFSENQGEKKAMVGKEHLADGLPEQHKWTADHLESYLRSFAKKHNLKQEDVDHLIGTFVKGPSSAKEFFDLGREALADRVGKANPERTRIGNLLAAELWKETAAIGSQIQSYGAILVGVAAVIFGAWAYNNMSGDDSKKAKDNVKSATNDAKNAASNAKDNVKSAAHDAKESVKSSAHDAKESAKSSAHDAKGTVMAGAHDMKEKAKSVAHDAKESVKSAAHDAKESVKNMMPESKESSKSAKSEVKGAARDIHETSKYDKEDANKKTAQAFKDDGAIGKQFTEKGAIGGAAQKVGGPFDKEGAIGKQFTKDGAIGGKVQDKAEEEERKRSR